MTSKFRTDDVEGTLNLSEASSAVMSAWVRLKSNRDDDKLEVVKQSILMRDRGEFAAADELAQAVLARDPSYPFAWYELAISRLMQGLHGDALAAIDELCGHHAEDVRAIALAVRLAALIGDGARARQELRKLLKLNPNHPDLGPLMDFVDYAGEFPCARSVYLCRRCELSPRFIGAASIIEKTRMALEARKGFSFVRMGDGEGAFIFLSAADDARFASLYARNREDRARVWFNGQVDLRASGFLDLTLRLREVIARADVVGLPYASWVAHEYKIGSITGISALVNLLRLCADPGVDVGQAFARQDAHVLLGHNGHLQQLLQSRPAVGLIGCHPELPAFVARTFGIGDVEFCKIPGEKLFADRIGAEAASGVHYPDRFNAIIADLSGRDLSGQLYLVAGGILGKFYCDRIKQQGGVALDIGSLVDSWVGVATRPGYIQTKSV